MGEIGGALHHVLQSQKGVTVAGWDKNASKIPNQTSLQENLHEAEIVFLCIPSWNLRGALASITPHLSPTASIISLAKGIEKESCRLADELLKEQLHEHEFGILGGPMIAEEMLLDKLTCGIFASDSATLRTRVKKLFKNSGVHIVASKDVRGVTMCGVLKNAYTLSIGIAEGLGMGENAKGALFSHALGEMQVLIKLLGGKTQTVLGLAGAGDLFATAMSPHSRNRTVGVVLGTGGDGHLESEGFMSLTCLEKLLPQDARKLQLLDCLIKIGHEQAPPTLLKEIIFDQIKK